MAETATDDVLRELVATKLAGRRHRAQLSLSAAAARIGIAKSYLLKLETSGNPTAAMVLQIARVYGCEPADLLPTRAEVESFSSPRGPEARDGD